MTSKSTRAQVKAAISLAKLTRHFKSDFVASLAVFPVAWLQCSGVAYVVGVAPGRAIVSGIIGGFIVGWIAGSPLQVSGPTAGARTRLATIMHRVWLVIFVCLLPWVLNYVPIAALGALLVYTGFRLLEPAKFRKLYKIGRFEAVIYFATAAVIVLANLSVGVMAGIALSTAKLTAPTKPTYRTNERFAETNLSRLTNW